MEPGIMRIKTPLALSLFMALCITVEARSTTLGIVAPHDGPYEILGAQIRNGARMAAEAAGISFVEIDESCEEGSGGAIGESLAAAQATAAVGFLCTETIAEALPALGNAGIATITLSSRSDILMEDALRKGWPLFRLAPSADSELEALRSVILRDWQGVPFALVEDGTVHNRELADQIRNALEEQGLKPLFIDTFRPGQEQQIALVRRLQRTGATHVFVAGDRSDISIMARDAASENIPLAILGGDVLKAADNPVHLLPGVYGVTLPDYSTRPEAAPALEKAAAAGVIPEGYTLPAWASVEIAVKAARDAAEQKKSLAEILSSATFGTVIGPVSFSATHELSANPFVLQQWNGTAFIPAEAARAAP